MLNLVAEAAKYLKYKSYSVQNSESKFSTWIYSTAVQVLYSCVHSYIFRAAYMMKYFFDLLYIQIWYRFYHSHSEHEAPVTYQFSFVKIYCKVV